MKLWNATGASLAVLAFSLTAGAQTTPTTPATCTTPPTGLTAFDIERTLTANGALTTLTPNVPANVLAAVTSGAQEVREHLTYNPQLGTVTSTVFLVAPGSPTPTPPNTSSASAIQNTTIKVSQILTSCSPTPSLLLVGTIITSPASGLYGSLLGAPAVVSIGYTTDNPPAINNVVVMAAGLILEYSTAATGTLTFPSVTVVPPGSTGAVAVKVQFPNGSFAQPGTTFQTPVSPLLLDATGSTGTGALTYSVTAAAGTPVAFVQTSTPGKVDVQFPNPGDYAITVTVTDSSGASNSETFTLEYTGRPQ
jgi:hypothetical protein